MKVWLFQVGEPLQIDSYDLRPMRAINLSTKLIEKGHQVVLWSSAFSHQEKKHRTSNYKVVQVNKNLEIRLIPSMGYRGHQGFFRILDHIQLSLNLKRELKKEKNLPDIAIIGFPPIEFAAAASRWLSNRLVPTVLDVKDLWPQIFVELLPKFLKPIGGLIFYPYFYFARRTINDVNAISAVTSSFLDSFLSFSDRSVSKEDKIFRLTSPIEKIKPEQIELAEQWWKKKQIDRTQRNIFFVGSFSRNFDFKPIRDAASEAISNGKKWRFILCGNGPKLNELKEMMSEFDNVFFPGWVDIAKINSLGSMSIATIAPYLNIDNFKNNIPNKVVDSLSLGLPILSPLEGEVGNLIQKYEVGLSYNQEKSLYQCIEIISSNKTLQQKLSRNSKKAYSDSFEFNQVYDDYISYLENLVEKNK